MKTPIVSLFLLATLSISCGEKPATPTLESSGSNLSSDIGDAPQVLPVNGGNSADAGYSGGGQPMQANMPMQEAPAYGQPAPAYGQPAPAYGQPAPAQGFPEMVAQPAGGYSDPAMGGGYSDGALGGSLGGGGSLEGLGGMGGGLGGGLDGGGLGGGLDGGGLGSGGGLDGGGLGGDMGGGMGGMMGGLGDLGGLFGGMGGGGHGRSERSYGRRHGWFRKYVRRRWRHGRPRKSG